MVMGTDAFDVPTVRLAWLAEMTRSLARDVRAGIYRQAGFNAEHRWRRRVYRDHLVDLWLIGWLPTQGTRLHDHGGSSGALTVVSGRLSEATYDPDAGSSGLRERVLGDGASVEFGGEYVHDVRNLSQAPAVSVHAYSPALQMMRFYAVRDGRLAFDGILKTDDPEPVIRYGLAGGERRRTRRSTRCWSPHGLGSTASISSGACTRPQPSTQRSPCPPSLMRQSGGRGC